MVNFLSSLLVAGWLLHPAYGMARSPGMVERIVQAHGGKETFYRMRDAQSTRVICLAEGTCESILERFLFDQEMSYGKDLNEGGDEEWFDGTQVFTSMPKPSPNLLKDIRIRRQAAFFWFALPFKLQDSGVRTHALERQTFEGQFYQGMEVTYGKAVGHVSDVYRLYMDSHDLIRWIHFTRQETHPGQWFLMKVEPQDISGVKLLTQRKLYASDAKARIGIPLQTERLQDVQFWNGFSKDDFRPVTRPLQTSDEGQ